LTVLRLRREAGLSVRRLARSFELPVSRIGRWIGPARRGSSGSRRRCPVSGDAELRRTIQELCLEERYQGYGYRRIWALLRRRGWRINRKTVWRIMREAGLSRPKMWHRRSRPKRVEKMQPASADQAWQIDMTSFQLADLTPLFLVVVTDCFTREIVGWTLDRRCRAAEWVSAVRQALEYRGWRQKGDLAALVLRSDNGAQPCSKRFAEYLGTVGIRGQYTGYNATRRQRLRRAGDPHDQRRGDLVEIRELGGGPPGHRWVYALLQRGADPLGPRLPNPEGVRTGTNIPKSCLKVSCFRGGTTVAVVELSGQGAVGRASRARGVGQLCVGGEDGGDIVLARGRAHDRCFRCWASCSLSRTR